MQLVILVSAFLLNLGSSLNCSQDSVLVNKEFSAPMPLNTFLICPNTKTGMVDSCVRLVSTRLASHLQLDTLGGGMYLKVDANHNHFEGEMSRDKESKMIPSYAFAMKAYEELEPNDAGRFLTICVPLQKLVHEVLIALGETVICKQSHCKFEGVSGADGVVISETAIAD